MNQKTLERPGAMSKRLYSDLLVDLDPGELEVRIVESARVLVDIIYVASQYLHRGIKDSKYSPLQVLGHPEFP